MRSRAVRFAAVMLTLDGLFTAARCDVLAGSGEFGHPFSHAGRVVRCHQTRSTFTLCSRPFRLTE